MVKNEILDKELVQNLLKLKGECRGMHLKNDADFVLKKKGRKGLKKVEDELERLGFPIKYKEIKSMGFYPMGLRAVSLLAIKKVFDWQDKEIKELCAFATGISLIVKVYMKFFHSIKKMVKSAPKMWHEYFTEGELIVADYNKEKEYTILEIKGFELHPVFCRCLEGYFENIVKMIVKAKEVQCQETKCTFKGQDCHQFKITWK